MKRSEVFEWIDPPPGGLAKLRGRLDERPYRTQRFVLALAGAATLACVVIGMRPRGMDIISAARQRAEATEIELGVLQMPKTTVRLAGAERASMAMMEVRTANPKVAFYWVDSTAWSEEVSRN